MDDLQQESLDIGGPSLIEPKVGSVRVPLESLVVTRWIRHGAHVTPFPNQEWVSSWAMTSTRVRSPASKANDS